MDSNESPKASKSPSSKSIGDEPFKTKPSTDQMEAQCPKFSPPTSSSSSVRMTSTSVVLPLDVEPQSRSPLFPCRSVEFTSTGYGDEERPCGQTDHKTHVEGMICMPQELGRLRALMRTPHTNTPKAAVLLCISRHQS